jgi:hypothetical protein
MAYPTPGEAEELARLLWDAFRGSPITLDARGRPNYIIVRHLARRLLRVAYEAGVSDPLRTVDWRATLDPSLSPEENLRLTAMHLAASAGRRAAPSEELDYVVGELERHLDELRSELEAAPPEQREALMDEMRHVEAELERARRAARPAERRARPPRRVRVPPPPPPPPPPPKARELPLEEARFRLERYIRERVPRTYRIDWVDLRARIFHHRDATDELRGLVEELGGSVVESRPVRPPGVVTTADLGEARVPPTALPPDVERFVLWSKFTAALLAMGVRPEEHREEFERAYAAMAGLPLEEKERRVERLIATLRPPPAAPPVAIPRALEERLAAIERRLDELRRAAAWRPTSPEELRMLMTAAYAVPPGLVVRADAAGHPFIGPDDRTLTTLANMLDRWAVLYFTSCPSCRYTLPGGALSPVDFAEHLITVERRVPPDFIEWLRRFARMMEEAEARGAA